jgi:hypothetical protein
VLGIGRDRREVLVLSELLAAKLTAGGETGAAGLSRGVEDERRLRTRLQFVQHQFAAPMANYTRFGGWYGFAFTLISLAALTAGIVSSGIAAGWSAAHWARWTILVLGLVTAAASVINQIWRPGQKSTSRTRGGNSLRREAWEFLNDRGAYENLNFEEAWGHFVDAVSAIVRQAEEIDETPTPEIAALTRESSSD